MVQAAYFILFFAIGIISVRISYSDRILTFNYSNGIRGIFSILIVMGHVFSTFNERNLIVKGLEGLSGPMTVGVFFMLSGYGLQWSRKHRCGYMHEFLRKRLSTLLYPFVFYVVIFFIFRIITNRHIENPIKDIFMGNYVPASWFVIELVFLYLLFYVIYSHKSSRLKSVLLSGGGYYFS